MGDGFWLPVIKGQHMLVCMRGYRQKLYQAGWHRRLNLKPVPAAVLSDGTGFLY